MKKSYKRRLFSLFKVMIIFALISLVIACGGGGGGTDGDGTGTSTLTLTLSASTVSYGTPVTVTATLRDANGDLVSGALVTFSSTADLVTFTPSSATALTDDDGIATISLNATSIDSAGATYITASADFTSNGTTTSVTSNPVGITVNTVSVSLGAITLGASSISAYGTSSVSVPVLVGGSAATDPVEVSFTSPCVDAGKASLSTPVNSIAGVAMSTYKDEGCGSGTDVITASVAGTSQTATINVALPTFNNIQFVSAEPEVIATSSASSSTLPTSSLVSFKVVDSNNSGVKGTAVDFSIIPASALGGITLSSAQETSADDGTVFVSLSSGTIPTPVWVLATIHGTSLKSQSNTLTITTGLPAQNLFSLSAEKFNIEGLKYDNVTTTLNIIASDRLGNPVPDGTAINFVSPESGQIDATCSTTEGQCSVEYRSSGDRPTDGRATIIAYAVGEESFVDLDGDNSYDPGETFYDLGDLYVDFDEDGIWDNIEQYYAPLPSAAGSSACLARPGGTALPDTYDNVQSKANTCNAAWGQNYVRRSAVIVLSDSVGIVTPTTVYMGGSCTRYFTLYVSDKNSNAMPADTTVSVKESDVQYIPHGETAQSDATVDIVGGSPVLSTTSNMGTPIVLKVKADCAGGTPVTYPQGTALLNITTPKGNITTIQIIIN